MCYMRALRMGKAASVALLFSLGCTAQAEPSDTDEPQQEAGQQPGPRGKKAERAEQLKFELKQLQLMNERQQRLIDKLETRLEDYRVQKQAPTDRSVTTAEKVGTDKRDQRTQESRSNLDDILQEEHAVFSRRLTIEPAITYTAADRKQLSLSGFLAVDAIFLGRLDVDEVDNRVVNFEVTTRYTLTDTAQVYLKIPYIYRRTEYASAGVDFSSASSSGVRLSEQDLGDVAFGAVFRAVEESELVPDVVVTLGGRAPTGTDPFGVKVIAPDPNNSNLRVPEKLATGSGVWAASLGVSMVKTLDPAVVFGGVEYTYQFEEELNDISTTPGTRTKGEVRLGDYIQFNLGTAFALNEVMSLNFSFANQLLDETRIRTGREWVYIPGSSANIATFNVGSTFRVSNDRSFVVSLATGLTREASDFSLSLRMPIQI